MSPSTQAVAVAVTEGVACCVGVSVGITVGELH